MAVVLITGGRLGDVYGRKRMLLSGWPASSSLRSRARPRPRPGELIAIARRSGSAVGAFMLPQVLGLIRDLFAPRRWARRSRSTARSWACRDARPDRRWRPRSSADCLGTRLARDLPRQHPDRDRRAHARAQLLPDAPPDAASRAGPARHRARRRGDVPARLPARPGPRAGLAAVDRRDARRLGADVGACSPASRSGASAAATPR